MPGPVLDIMGKYQNRWFPNPQGASGFQTENELDALGMVLIFKILPVKKMLY